METHETLSKGPSSVAAARATARAALAGTPIADDAELVTSELVTNALRHGSGPDDEITVRITRRLGSARIAVTDTGARVWNGRVVDADEAEESGRGLLIVAELAAKLGHDVRAGEQTVWVELVWNEAP
ncbi:hypothetical protein GCM10027589_02950 [Actinocorallia lasiicapitis]